MKKQFLSGGALVACVVAMLHAPAAMSANEEVHSIVLKDHRFSVETIKVPANKRVKLRVTNQDDAPEEFDSSALKVEKVISPRTTAVILIGPLAPGKYAFRGEFHEETAHGEVIAE